MSARAYMSAVEYSYRSELGYLLARDCTKVERYTWVRGYMSVEDYMWVEDSMSVWG